MAEALSLAVRPLTPARWGDLEKLFGPHGGCAHLTEVARPRATRPIFRSFIEGSK